MQSEGDWKVKTKLSKKVIVIMIITVIVIMSTLILGGISMMREINENQSVSIDKLNTIQVNMSSVGVHIIQTEASKEVKVNFHGKAMQDIKLISETANNTLYIKVERKHENLPLYEDVALDVYIPKSYTKSLSIKMLSGDVKIDSLNLENFIYDNASGKLDAEQLEADKLSIISSSGNLNIKKLTANNLDIKGKSSAVKIDECIANEAKIETTAGKVLVSYKKFDNQHLNIATSSGSVTLELPAPAEFFIESKTSSGKFQSDFPINVSNKNDIKGQIGTSNNIIGLQTSSGSLQILKK